MQDPELTRALLRRATAHHSLRAIARECGVSHEKVRTFALSKSTGLIETVCKIAAGLKRLGYEQL